MPVEIRELIIRAVVQEAAKPGETPAAAPDMGMIIEECVRQILKILKTKGER